VNKQDLSARPSWVNTLFTSGRLFWIFSLFWAVIFVVYLPAAQAGRVGDFPGWVHFLNSVGFIDYLNRSESGIPSMYQFTQMVTLVFYKMWGANAWAWHLLYVTLHALNALLIFTFFRRLFFQAAIKNAASVAFSGAILFCITPHASEVVVWEPAFHYLLGLLLMLTALHCTQSFILTKQSRFAWWGGIVFFLSSYSLEVFYLTPLFVVTLALYYFIVLRCEKKVFVRVLLCFLLPQVVFFALNLVLLRTRYHEGVAHITSNSIRFNAATFSKALKYVFHILFLGRYFPREMRAKMYRFAESGAGLSLFYGTFLIIVAGIALRFRTMKSAAKTGVLLFTWVVLSIGLIMPLWFPDTGLVILDRYLYVPCAFIYIFLAFLLNGVLTTYLFIAVIFLYALLGLRFTHKANSYWQQSAKIVNNLVYTFPNDPSKKVLLLNLPECLDGVQMIGSRTEGEFAMMYDAIMPDKLKNPVYDVEAYYLQGPGDGAHVTVINDTACRVTLNQWGTWWLFYGFGATSYANEEFRVDMKDEGHLYELILKHPANEYLLLYEVDGQWKTVDWRIKNTDQN
jgi:hypothetical protein